MLLVLPEDKGGGRGEEGTEAPRDVRSLFILELQSGFGRPSLAVRCLPA